MAPRNARAALGRVATRRRTLIALSAIAGVALVAVPNIGHAAPQPTLAQVQAQVNQLYQQAEVATQRYDGAQEQLTTEQRQAAQLRAAVATAQAAYNTTQDRLGAVAAEEYRSGGIDPTLQAMISTNPGQLLDEIGDISQVSDTLASTLRTAVAQKSQLVAEQAAAQQKLTAIQQTATQLGQQKARIQSELAQAQRLLNSLQAQQRAELLAQQRQQQEQAAAAAARAQQALQAQQAQSAQSSGGLSVPSDVPASGRAIVAIQFALAQVGKPYVWGATGPGAYDCSGLMQAAWAAAGVNLPRTTYGQIDAGQQISASQLVPGDLVFYYAGPSHVAMYIGNGEIVQAANPSVGVVVSPMNSMPITGYVHIS